MSLLIDQRRCELLCEVGSGAHGLAIDDTNDHDELGVFVEPMEYVIGLKKWETSVIRFREDGTPIPDGERSGPGDTDLTIHSLRKYISLALNGNPTIITLMFAPVIRSTAVGDMLRESGPERLISRRALNAYLGYLKQQRERLLGDRGQKRTKRPELVEKYGFDTKYAAHALRLGLQGIELAETGRLSLPMIQEDREYLRALRRGEIPFEEAIEAIEGAEEELIWHRDDSARGVLAEQPDRDWANNFLVGAYMTRWGR